MRSCVSRKVGSYLDLEPVRHHLTIGDGVQDLDRLLSRIGGTDVPSHRHPAWEVATEGNSWLRSVGSAVLAVTAKCSEPTWISAWPLARRLWYQPGWVGEPPLEAHST